MAEYQVVLMDPTKRAFHQPQEPLLETDNLAIACSFCYEKFQKDGIDIGVYQPRHQCYREHYQADPQPEPEDTCTKEFVVFWTATFMGKPSSSTKKVHPCFMDFDDLKKARAFRDRLESMHRYNDTYRGRYVGNIGANFS